MGCYMKPAANLPADAWLAYLQTRDARLRDIEAYEAASAPAPVSGRYQMLTKALQHTPRPRSHRPRSTLLSSRPWPPAIQVGTAITIRQNRGVWLAYRDDGTLLYAATSFQGGLATMLTKAFADTVAEYGNDAMRVAA